MVSTKVSDGLSYQAALRWLIECRFTTRGQLGRSPSSRIVQVGGVSTQTVIADVPDWQRRDGVFVRLSECKTGRPVGRWLFATVPGVPRTPAPGRPSARFYG